VTFSRPFFSKLLRLDMILLLFNNIISEIQGQRRMQFQKLPGQVAFGEAALGPCQGAMLDPI
jgi:hypothetical protein